MLGMVGQAQHRQQFVRVRGVLRRRTALQRHGQQHVVDHAAPFQQRRGLEHIAQLRAGGGGRTVPQADVAGLRPQQAGGQLQQRRLAAAAASDQAMKSTGLQSPIDTVDDGWAARVGIDRPFDVQKRPGHSGVHGS
ncbi:hypothetical protein G6F22_016484 [Rhizopus arrhizus]|nr:hypothetical protein G6F22_016484 [Rhizopus arrhizus]KAG1245444.1 hypothetical protein G6F65_021229 [Rhizopus arrhizus]